MLHLKKIHIKSINPIPINIKKQIKNIYHLTIMNSGTVNANRILPKTLVLTFSHAHQATECHDPQITGS